MSFLESQVYKLTAPLQLVLETQPLQLPAERTDYLLAETLYTCISPGTEIAAYAGMSPLRPGSPYPRVVGYCNVARVTEKGSGITDVNAGDLILSFQSHRSHFLLTGEDFYLRLPQSAEPQLLATAYLFHLGYHSLITADARQGHVVGVIGAGVLGVTTAMMSGVSGAHTVLFSGQDINTGNDNGIRYCSKSEAAVVAVLAELKSTGFDIIVNTSNTWADWLLALKLARRGGVIVNMGFPGRGQKPPSFNPLDPQYVYVKQLTIKALCPINETDIPVYDIRFNMKRNLEHIIRLIGDGRLCPRDLITDEISYEQLGDQYEKYRNRTGRMLSTLIKWKN